MTARSMSTVELLPLVTLSAVPALVALPPSSMRWPSAARAMELFPCASVPAWAQLLSLSGISWDLSVCHFTWAPPVPLWCATLSRSSWLLTAV